MATAPGENPKPVIDAPGIYRIEWMSGEQSYGAVYRDEPLLMFVGIHDSEPVQLVDVADSIAVLWKLRRESVISGAMFWDPVE